MRQLLPTIAIAGALAICGCGKAQPGEPTLKYPNTYAAWKRDVECRMPAPYFECDYTTRRCLRGTTNRGGGEAGYLFVGEVLAEDRTTVVAHVMRMGNYWFNFDTGEASVPGGRKIPPSAASGLFGINDDDQPPPSLGGCAQH